MPKKINENVYFEMDTYDFWTGPHGVPTIFPYIGKVSIFPYIGFVPLNFIFLVGVGVFLTGFFGTWVNINNRIVNYFMSIELMWLGISLGFLGIYIWRGFPEALVLPIIVLSFAAAETAVGLALLINYYRVNKSTNTRTLSNLRG
jgi:NADH-quinone oxidoreductase subunit K